jgi:hypothetical protein
MDMRGEKDYGRIFEEGWHDFEIVKIEEQISKNNNQMFKISLALADKPTEGIEVYAITEAGKRWFLKQFLGACGCEAAEDGIYDWSPEDYEGLTIQCRIENQEETWIDRNGYERKTLKSKVVEFKKLEIK